LTRPDWVIHGAEGEDHEKFGIWGKERVEQEGKIWGFNGRKGCENGQWRGGHSIGKGKNIGKRV